MLDSCIKTFSSKKFGPRVFLTTWFLLLTAFTTTAFAQYPDSQIWSVFPKSTEATGVNDGLKSESKRKDGDNWVYMRSWRAGSQSRSLSITLTVYADAKQASNAVRDYGKALGKGNLYIGDECYWTETSIRPYYMMARGNIKVTLFTRYARGAPVGDQSYLLRLMVSRIDALTKPSSIVVDCPKNLTTPDRFKISINAKDAKGRPLAGHIVSIRARNPPSVPKVSFFHPSGNLDSGGSFETEGKIASATGAVSDLGKKMNFIITILDPKTRNEVSHKRISPNLVAVKIDRILPLQAVEGAKLIADKPTGVRVWLDGNSPDCSLEAKFMLDGRTINSLTIPEGFPGKTFDGKSISAAKDSINAIIAADSVHKGKHTITVDLNLLLRKHSPLASTSIEATWFTPRNFKVLIAATHSQVSKGKLARFLGGFGKDVANFLQQVYPVKKVRIAVDSIPLKTVIGLPAILPGLLKAIEAENLRRAYNKNHRNEPADFIIAVYPKGAYRDIKLEKKQGIYYGNSKMGRLLGLRRVALVQNDSPRASAHEIGHFIIKAKDEYILGDNGRAGIYLENVSTFNSNASSFRYYPKGQDAVYNFMGSYIGSPFKRFWVNKETFDKLYKDMGKLPQDLSFSKTEPTTKHYMIPIRGSGEAFQCDNLQSIAQGIKTKTKNNSLVLPIGSDPKTSLLIRKDSVLSFNQDTVVIETGAILAIGKQKVSSTDGTISISCKKGSFAIFADKKKGWIVRALKNSVLVATPQETIELSAGQGLAIGTDAAIEKTADFDPQDVTKNFLSESSTDPKEKFPWFEQLKRGHR